MNQKDIEQGLRRAFAQSTPDLTDAILSECGERRGEIVTMKRNTSEWSENGTATARRARPGKFARIVAAAAALLLVVSGAFVGTIAVRNAQADKAAASGSITVEEAKEIVLNDAGLRAEETLFETVKQKDVNGAASFELHFSANNVEYDYAVNAKNGTILSKASSRVIEENVPVTTEVPSQPTAIPAQPTPAPSTGTAVAELTMDEAKAIALKHAGVTADKAVFTEQKREFENGRPVYEFDFYADGVEYDYEIDAVTGEVRKAEWEKKTAGGTTPTAQPAANELTMDEAKAIALKHAGVSSEKAVFTEQQREFENGKPVYEFDFYADGVEYDYEIDAVTGEVRKAEWEKKTAGGTAPTAQPAANELTMDEAKAIALKHAGVSSEKAVFTEQQREFENGKPVYEFDFHADGVEYDYEIDAVTGEVRKAEWEKKTAGGTTPTAQPAANELTMDEAKAIALKHAGVTADKAVFTEQKREFEDGRLVYEFDFHADGVEYDYEIDAVTGEVRKAEWEKKTAGGTAQTPKPNQNTKPTAKPTDKTSSYIGASKAKSIALNHAGVSSGAARELKCELDRENGRMVYEVDFKANGYEYDYEIDAVSGKVLKHEKERDD